VERSGAGLRNIAGLIACKNYGKDRWTKKRKYFFFEKKNTSVRSN